jgi:hypothetical protein
MKLDVPGSGRLASLSSNTLANQLEGDRIAAPEKLSELAPGFRSGRRAMIHSPGEVGHHSQLIPRLRSGRFWFQHPMQIEPGYLDNEVPHKPLCMQRRKLAQDGFDVVISQR